MKLRRRLAIVAVTVAAGAVAELVAVVLRLIDGAPTEQEP